jgi:broad specificity phosphatase PhoE
VSSEPATTALDTSPCLARRLAAGKTEEPATLLIRHAERERIEPADVAGALQAPLTGKGREEARSLGAELQATGLVRLFYSPVPRCFDTARCIAEGVTAAGGDSELVGSRSFLAAPFARDGGKIVEAIAGVGLRGFITAWFAGELDASVVDDAQSAAKLLLAALIDARSGQKQGGLDIHVSHDIVIMALLGLAWDMSGRIPWPGFLDGVCLSYRDARETALWYHGEEKVVSFDP